MRYPHTLLTLNQNLSTGVTKQRELVKYVAIENTFQNFQMGPMQHLDRETCIRNIFLVGQVLMDFGTFAPHESYD